jgi:Zn finger protein HypA/HybF involved in hydrogenase expression
MITKKQLLTTIANSSDDAVITVLGQGDIIHIVQDEGILLSSEKPIGICNKCGSYVYPETNQGLEQYKGFCPKCDENMYELEFAIIINHNEL